ncbi:MAG: DUF4386 domain-containing protein [Hyphomonadaceae bacterium]
MTSPQLSARIAGLLYLFVVVASTFALVTVSGLVVRGDPAASAANILASEQMYRLSIGATLLSAIAYTAVVALLYALFKAVNRPLAIASAFIGLAGCAASATFLVNQLAALSLLGGAETHTQQLAQHALRLAALGNTVSLVFFGFYCLTLSALVFGATFLPRLLGLFLLVAGVGWLVGNLGAIVAPDMLGPLSRYLVPVSGVGEFIFTLWLLIMGVNPEKWKAQAGET